LYGGPPLIRSLRNTDLSDRTRKRQYRRSIPETNQRQVLTDVYRAVRGYRGPASSGPPVPMAPVPGTGTSGTAGYRCGYYRRVGTALVPAGARSVRITCPRAVDGTQYRGTSVRRMRVNYLPTGAWKVFPGSAAPTDTHFCTMHQMGHRVTGECSNMCKRPLRAGVVEQ
jgi:hypothetical protein